MRFSEISGKVRSWVGAVLPLSSGWQSRLGILLLLLAAAVPGSLRAGTITLDFEGFADNTSLTTQYPGITFSNATVISAGISLNEFELPPHSGVNVASDNNGSIRIDFAKPITSFSGYFTNGFDRTENELASAASLYSSNGALFGEFRQALACNIAGKGDGQAVSSCLLGGKSCA